MSKTDLIDARLWRKRNKGLWERRVVAPVLADAERKRPILLQQVFEDIRKHDHVDDTGQPVHVDNNHIAIFARMLWCEYPEVRPYLRLRRSDWDEAFGIGIGVDGQPRKKGGK